MCTGFIWEGNGSRGVEGMGGGGEAFKTCPLISGGFVSDNLHCTQTYPLYAKCSNLYACLIVLFFLCPGVKAQPRKPRHATQTPALQMRPLF